MKTAPCVRFFAAATAALCLASCSTPLPQKGAGKPAPAPAPTATPPQTPQPLAQRPTNPSQPGNLQAGYTLLSQLAGQLRRVDQVFILKTAAPAVEDAVSPVSALFNEVDRDLKSWIKSDPALGWSGTVLPAIESDTRKALEKIRTSELLSASGAPFERRLLASQDEGLAYAAALMGQLAAADSNPTRKAKLAEWERRAGQIRQNIAALLFAP